MSSTVPFLAASAHLCRVRRAAELPVLSVRSPLRDCVPGERDPKKFRLVRKGADGQGMAQGASREVTVQCTCTLQKGAPVAMPC